MDRQRPLVADPRASIVKFEWRPAAAARASLDYTAFVVEYFDAGEAAVTGGDGVTVRAYYGAAEHNTLVVLSGPNAPGPYVLTLTRRRPNRQARGRRARCVTESGE